MYKYAVGERYDDLVSEEGIRFDMTDEGGMSKHLAELRDLQENQGYAVHIPIK